MGVSCAPRDGSASAARTGAPPASISPAAFDLGAIPSGGGPFERSFAVPGGKPRSALVWAPAAQPVRTLVLLLHGAVPRASSSWSPESQTQSLLECLAVPALRELSPLIIAPRSTRGEWWTPADVELVLGLTLAAQQRWPRAARRTVLLGYSNGGIGAWYFARVFPAHFAAAVPIATNHTIVGETPVPVYAIHGTKDELFSFQRVRSSVLALAEAGRDVQFREKYRGSHFDPCSYVPELTTGARWLEQHALGRTRGRALRELGSVPEFRAAEAVPGELRQGVSE